MHTYIHIHGGWRTSYTLRTRLGRPQAKGMRRLKRCGVVGFVVVGVDEDGAGATIHHATKRHTNTA